MIDGRNSLAAFKRHLKNAKYIEVINERYPHLSGVREIGRVQSNAFTTWVNRPETTRQHCDFKSNVISEEVEPAKRVESWFYFDSLNGTVNVSEDNMTAVFSESEPGFSLTYRIVSEQHNDTIERLFSMASGEQP